MKKSKLLLFFLLLIIAIIFTACTTKEVENTERKPPGKDYVISEQVDQTCMSCHAVNEGKLERISDVRKTPEGWLGTVQRMERIHGVKLTDEQREQIIKDLSRVQGLSPEEAEPVQYWMANKPSYSEANTENDAVNNSCISCHAGGRFEAQRRTEQEWKNLKDFHLVMFPSIYLNHRHMDWPKEAEEAIAYLAAQYQYDQEEWENWKGKEYDPSGKWKVVGFQATKGFYIGESEFSKEGNKFKETKTIQFLNSGKKMTQTGPVEMYGGFMLRAQFTDDKGSKQRGTYNILKNGTLIKGDWSQAKDLGISAEETYFKVQTDVPEIIYMEEKALKIGSTAKIHIYGMNLTKAKKEAISLPNGVTVKSFKTESDEKAVLTIEVNREILPGQYEIKVENKAVHDQLTVYQNIDYLKIDPPYGVARVGDRGPMQKVSTQFTAYAYSNGKDGKKGTEDDLMLMPVKAEWTLKGYPDEANAEKVKFIGSIDENGLFTPLGEGINEKREYTQENVGAVTVHAKATVDGKTLKATSHHISTVPDYVNNVH
ncbi:quinohemoprotein amine dehydrogenase subunit alpha [Neobacillus mesonae]|uniref:quinohemoprotein amine dehydrogenase subunit alpha n=1 Tax=Neobacillus mesonae TaxID=1193713 RepID=UPI002E1E429E|nr:quinohemoprotein amine dehydrogenase subunit alpha [Neobacillus mesonae]